MKRRNLLALLGLAWLMGGSALAQQPYLMIQSAASTTTSGAFAVSVEVTVENRGKAASKACKVELTLKPLGSGLRPKSNVPTMWDPVTDSQDLPALEPGERKSLTFKTPFYSKYTFKNARGTFKVNNVDSTGVDVSVDSIVTTK